MVSEWIVTLSLVVTVLVAIYQYIRYKQSYFERVQVPHLKPTFIVGNQGAMLTKKRSFLDQVRWLYDQVPPDYKYYGFYDFTTPTIMLKDPDLIKDITVKYFDNCTDHTAFTIDELDPLFSKNLFALRGQKWREFRAMLSPSFTASKLKGMFNLINKCALDFKEYLRKENNESVPIDTKDLFTRYTNDVIATAAFGISMNSLRERDNEFYQLARKCTTFDASANLKLFTIQLLPWVARIFRLRVVHKKISDYFINLIDSNIKTRQAQGITRPDMIQLMMQANEERKNDEKLDIVEMTAQAFIFLFGGFESTATTLCFVAHQVAAHPEVQERLYEEIKDKYSAINNDGTGYDALRDFHYLDAVISETLRMFPAAQMSDRVCTKSFELPAAEPGGKPFVVKRGTVFWLPIAGIHYDQQYHEEPEKFNPERFLDSDGSLKVKITDSPMYMPFGAGPRICIAHRFAMLEIKLIITHLLALYQLLPSDKTPSPIECSKKVFQMIPDNGFWLHLKPRNG